MENGHKLTQQAQCYALSILSQIASQWKASVIVKIWRFQQRSGLSLMPSLQDLSGLLMVRVASPHIPVQKNTQYESPYHPIFPILLLHFLENNANTKRLAKSHEVQPYCLRNKASTKLRLGFYKLDILT